MNTEIIATSYLKEVLATTDLLDPTYLKDGEKEPSWDGNLYLHENADMKKTGLKKIPVQVKGTIKASHPDKITFRMSLDDMDNYLRDGGVMLFVVYISNDKKRKTIYYESLLPIKIRILKDRNVGKKTIPVECKQFPSDPERMVSVCMNFYADMQKQRSFALAELKSLEELEKEGILEGLTFSVMAYGRQKNDVQSVLLQDTPYMYAKIKGSPIPQPLEMIPIGIHVAEDVPCTISAGGKVFYNSAKRIRSEGRAEFCIGKSFRIVAEGTKTSFNYTPTNMLSDALIDTEFMIAFAEAGSLQLNDILLPVEETKNMGKDKIRAQKERLEYCKEVKAVLDILGLDVDVDIKKTTDADIKNTDRFYRGIVKGEAVAHLRPDIPPVAKVDYYNLTLIIGFNKIAEPGTYNLYDFNSAPMLFAYEDGVGGHLSTSRYEILKAEDFLKLANIDLDKMVGSYKELSEYEHVYVDANMAVLRLLSAYDESKDSRKDLLEAAQDLAMWLLETDINEEVLSAARRKINLWQVLKRKGPLDKAILKEAYQIAEDSDQSDDIRVGANLILGNQFAAEKYFEQLPVNVQSEFREYPIFRYWKEE